MYAFKFMSNILFKQAKAQPQDPETARLERSNNKQTY